MVRTTSLGTMSEGWAVRHSIDLSEIAATRLVPPGDGAVREPPPLG